MKKKMKMIMMKMTIMVIIKEIMKMKMKMKTLIHVLMNVPLANNVMTCVQMMMNVRVVIVMNVMNVTRKTNDLIFP